MKRIKTLAILLVFAFIISGSMCNTHASVIYSCEVIDSTYEQQDESRSVNWNWWSSGWKVMYNALNQLIEVLVSLDGSSSYTSTQAYLVSPSIDFNTGSMAHTFRFKPVVNNDVYYFRLHGHRIVFVDIFSKIAISLRDANSDVVLEDLTTSNEYSIYYRSSTDPSGTWEASYTSTDSIEWQLYYTHYYDTGSKDVSDHILLSDNKGFYYGANNRVFQFSQQDYDDNQANKKTLKEQSLNLIQLNAQFIDCNGNAVDYLQDYNEGDILFFEDIIQYVEYNPETNITAFCFAFGDEWITWKFSGNYSNTYTPGDTLRLSFTVVNVDHFDSYTFESLDYFEEVYSAKTETELPPLSNYLGNEH